jgi:site-specific recombinase XerD
VRNLPVLLVDDTKLKEKFVIVRKGKGEKDRSIPLDDMVAIQLEEFLKGMTPKRGFSDLTRALLPI